MQGLRERERGHNQVSSLRVEERGHYFHFLALPSCLFWPVHYKAAAPRGRHGALRQVQGPRGWGCVPRRGPRGGAGLAGGVCGPAPSVRAQRTCGPGGRRRPYRPEEVDCVPFGQTPSSPRLRASSRESSAASRAAGFGSRCRSLVAVPAWSRRRQRKLFVPGAGGEEPRGQVSYSLRGGPGWGGKTVVTPGGRRPRRSDVPIQ